MNIFLYSLSLSLSLNEIPFFMGQCQSVQLARKSQFYLMLNQTFSLPLFFHSYFFSSQFLLLFNLSFLFQFHSSSSSPFLISFFFIETSVFFPSLMKLSEPKFCFFFLFLFFGLFYGFSIKENRRKREEEREKKGNS